MPDETTTGDVAGLVQHMVSALVSHPDDVQIHIVEGASSVIYELRVHPDDLDAVKGEDHAHMRAMQQLLAVAGGPRKPVLDLVETSAAGSEE